MRRTRIFLLNGAMLLVAVFGAFLASSLKSTSGSEKHAGEVAAKVARVVGDAERYQLYGDDKLRIWRVRTRSLGPHVLLPDRATGAVVVLTAENGQIAVLRAERQRESFEPVVHALGEGAVFLLRHDIVFDGASTADVELITPATVRNVWKEQDTCVAQDEGNITMTRFILSNGLDGSCLLVRLSEVWTKEDDKWRFHSRGQAIAAWDEAQERFQPLGD